MFDDPEMGTARRVLRRVVPIATTNARAGLTLTLIALEAYTSGFEIRGRLVVPQTHPARTFATAQAIAAQERLNARARTAHGAAPTNVAPMVLHTEPTASPAEFRSLLPRLGVVVHDDRGNSYGTHGHGSGSNGQGEFGLEFLFTPALDQEANELHIGVAEITWDVVPPARNDSTPARVDAGPWVVVVDLSAGRNVFQTGDPN